jgi:hypothetical protein
VKTYFASTRFRSSWENALLMCANLDMELVTFQSLDEQNSFKARFNSTLLGLSYKGFFIGAMTGISRSTTEWYWTDNNQITANKKINYPINWMKSPQQPDNYLGKEFCMNIYMRTANEFVYNDIQCSESFLNYVVDPMTGLYFICQDVSIFVALNF